MSAYAHWINATSAALLAAHVHVRHPVHQASEQFVLQSASVGRQANCLVGSVTSEFDVFHDVWPKIGGLSDMRLC